MTKKKIVLLLDGSWQSRGQAFVRGIQSRLGVQYLGNVALLAQAIKKEDADGNPQISFYQDGVGTSPGLLTNIIAGATGAGLGNNLIEAYSFLCDNYNSGDEIFLIGFSRGAYTARALSGFILWAGIMTKAQLAWIQPIYTAYQRRSPSQPDQTDFAAKVLYYFTGTWPSEESDRVEGDEIQKRFEMGQKQGSKASLRDPKRLEAQRQGPHVVPPPIKFIGVMDTVGALGIPGQFSTPWARKYYEFFDTGLSSNIQIAFQALAMSENRKDFTPTLWDRFDPKGTQEMKEVFFPGSHGDVGGGHPDHGLSDIVLACLCAQLTDHSGGPLLALDLDLIKTLQDRSQAWAKQTPYPSRYFFQFKKSRQVCRSLMEQIAAIGKKDGDKDKVPTWADEVPFGPSREMLHHSVVMSGRYDPEKSEEFELLRKYDPQRLKMLWASAADESTLLPTEKFLKWNAADPNRPDPLSASWAQAPSWLSPLGVRRYLALKDAMVYFNDGVQIGFQVVTWPVNVTLNTIWTLDTSTENLAGRPPPHPAKAAGQSFRLAAGRLKDAFTGRQRPGVVSPPA
ncbi:hypothetical protein OC861_006860 [Tilletia horrida]|nr:hypothetical protein OC861_006860 [Tilletia horrida]